MNAYEAKQARRRERLLARAEAKEREASRRFEAGDLREEKSGIPFGQPILVGHHSEKKHRRAIERADNHMRKGVEASRQADELQRRANAVGSGGISSDDPDAVPKLKARLQELEALQERMKATNAAWRSAGRPKDADAPAWATVEAKLREAGVEGAHTLAAAARRAMSGNFVDRSPYPPYALTNNGANMKRIAERIRQLETFDDRETKETERPDGIKIIENAELNRLQIVFPGKPDGNTRARLKSHGFRWSPSEQAWQRHLTGGAKYAAKLVLGD